MMSDVHTKPCDKKEPLIDDILVLTEDDIPGKIASATHCKAAKKVASLLWCFSLREETRPC